MIDITHEDRMFKDRNSRIKFLTDVDPSLHLAIMQILQHLFKYNHKYWPVLRSVCRMWYRYFILPDPEVITKSPNFHFMNEEILFKPITTDNIIQIFGMEFEDRSIINTSFLELYISSITSKHWVGQGTSFFKLLLNSPLIHAELKRPVALIFIKELFVNRMISPKLLSLAFASKAWGNELIIPYLIFHIVIPEYYRSHLLFGRYSHTYSSQTKKYILDISIYFNIYNKFTNTYKLDDHIGNESNGINLIPIVNTAFHSFPDEDQFKAHTLIEYGLLWKDVAGLFLKAYATEDAVDCMIILLENQVPFGTLTALISFLTQIPKIIARLLSPRDRLLPALFGHEQINFFLSVYPYYKHLFNAEIINILGSQISSTARSNFDCYNTYEYLYKFVEDEIEHTDHVCLKDPLCFFPDYSLNPRIKINHSSSYLSYLLALCIKGGAIDMSRILLTKYEVLNPQCFFIENSKSRTLINEDYDDILDK